MISQSTKNILKYHKTNKRQNKVSQQTFITWQPHSWKQLVAQQQPIYENQGHEVNQILNEIQRLPPLVRFEDIVSLRSDLTKVANGHKFIIQMGDCAETFSECSEATIHKKLEFLQNMGNQFQKITNQKVVLIGRICGQFAKPRSNQYEKQGIFAYRGDLINGINEEDRKPDPKRLLLGAMWQQAGIQVLKSFEEQQSFRMKQKIWISHECLHLDYESSLVRSSEDQKYYNSSAHFLWLGERTRNIDQAHVYFASGIHNPVGVKVSSDITKKEFLQLNKTLNPGNLPNRLIIITRIGITHIENFLPQLIRWKKEAGIICLWMCDPMHGNTITFKQIKTRLLCDIKNELAKFFAILHQAGETASGIHLESTPFDVSECMQDDTQIGVLGNYLSACDPRLNNNQTQDVLSTVGELYKKYKLQKKLL